MIAFRNIIALSALVLCFVGGKAQTLNLDDGVCHWEGGLVVGINNDGYGLDASVAYFPLQYVGVRIGVGVAGEIWELEDYLNDNEYYDTDTDYAARFKFNPAIVFRSPRLIDWKSQNGGFYLFTEPGIVLSPGSRGSRNAQHYRWDVKSGINFQVDRFIFTIGYGISNFSLYSGAPVNHWGLPDNTNYITHTGFIGGAIKF